MLEIDSISKTFHPGTPNEVRALRDVNLKIQPHGFVIVIGMNGSGKSTLLNAVAGTFFLDRGAIRLNGQDVTRWPAPSSAPYYSDCWWPSHCAPAWTQWT